MAIEISKVFDLSDTKAPKAGTCLFTRATKKAGRIPPNTPCECGLPYSDHRKTTKQERKRNYYKENREEIAADRAQHRKENLETYRKKERNYYQATLEASRARNNRSREKNKDKINEKQRQNYPITKQQVAAKKAENKQKLVEHYGSQCGRCCESFDILRVYDFHHIDPNEKETTFNVIARKPWDQIAAEILDKCVMLCACCHKMTHFLLREVARGEKPLSRKQSQRREIHRKLIEHFGDKCQDCGNRQLCDTAYDFHHRDPATKFANVSSLYDTSWEQLLAEAQKCDLLCTNCHRKRHALLDVENDLGEETDDDLRSDDEEVV